MDKQTLSLLDLPHKLIDGIVEVFSHKRGHCAVIYVPEVYINNCFFSGAPFQYFCVDCSDPSKFFVTAHQSHKRTSCKTAKVIEVMEETSSRMSTG